MVFVEQYLDGFYTLSAQEMGCDGTELEVEVHGSLGNLIARPKPHQQSNR